MMDHAQVSLSKGLCDYYFCLFFYLCFSKLIFFNVALLPLGVPYELDQLANNQPKLSDFFASKGSHVPEDAPITSVYQAKLQTEDASLNDGCSNNDGLSEMDVSTEHEGQISVEIENPALDNDNEKMTEQQFCCDGKSCEENVAERSSSDIENESSVKNGHQSSTLQPATSSTVASSRKCHSTLGDPNFVENYFKVVKWKVIACFCFSFISSSSVLHGLF